MREIVETWTDVAALAAGDPSILADLHVEGMRAFEAARERAVAAGTFWRTELTSDGSYLFYVFVDEDPPRELRPFMKEPWAVPEFQVPSGRLLVAGEEYFNRTDPVPARSMVGRELRIPPGRYSLTAYHCDYPDGFEEDAFATLATPAQRTAWRWGQRLSTWCTFLTFGAVATGCVVSQNRNEATSLFTGMAVAAAGWAGRYVFCRRDAYRSAARLYREAGRQWPAFVLGLRRVS